MSESHQLMEHIVKFWNKVIKLINKQQGFEIVIVNGFSRLSKMKGQIEVVDVFLWAWNFLKAMN